ncbi:MAG: OprD family outer membrane porin, partial [Leadbetterella sp.]|nr:OprD family outer membrane porin [Leadbetterella sp.]
MPVESTPLLNKSDGRMKPFAFQGAWVHHHHKGNTLDVGWIHKVSPRSMNEWYGIQEAIGLTDNGLQPDGTPAGYHRAAHSAGIGTLRWGMKRDHWHLDMWNLYLDKINNSTWMQLELHKGHWMLGSIYSFQAPLAYQKTLEYGKRYVQPDERGRVLSLAGTYRQNGWQFKSAYSRAFATGRYLFP